MKLSLEPPYRPGAETRQRFPELRTAARKTFLSGDNFWRSSLILRGILPKTKKSSTVLHQPRLTQQHIMKNRIPSLRPLCHQRAQVLPLRRNHSTSKPPNAQPQPRPQPNNKLQFKDIPATAVNYYWDTQAPDESQLAYADKVFAPSRHSPVKLWTLSKFRTTPLSSTTPEVAFLGRSNVGKSSLLTALMGQEICWTSSKPGRTQTMNAFGIGGTKGGESKVVLLDMPGYGKGSRSEWGNEIMKYLKNRKQ